LLFKQKIMNKYLDYLKGLNNPKINNILDQYNQKLISLNDLIMMINPVNYDVESYNVFFKSIKMDMILSDEITERFLDDDIHD